MTTPNTIVKDLGWCIAKAQFRNTAYVTLTIVSPSAAEENSYNPSESVTISTEASIESLRDLCNEILEDFKKQKTQF